MAVQIHSKLHVQTGCLAGAGCHEISAGPHQQCNHRKLSRASPAECAVPYGWSSSGTESDDNSTELAATEGSDDDSDDATPVVLPPVFSQEETLLLVDWDDTLLPTSWLRLHGYSLHGRAVSNKDHLMQLRTLADAVSRTLDAAHQLGKVVIVTNAETGWVQLSCRKFFPSLLAPLERFDIISARSTYQSKFARTPMDWKRAAFMHEVTSYYGKPHDHRFWNVIVLGDSMYEKHALYYATQTVKASHAKFVKFVERPSLQELIAEHEEVGCCVRNIVDYNGDLNLYVLGRGQKQGTHVLTGSFDV